VETLTDSITEETKINNVEDKRHRIVSQQNAALTAKLAFIQDKYDFNSNVKNLKPDDFQQLEDTNTEVRIKYNNGLGG
jgi:hypothetical protein